MADDLNQAAALDARADRRRMDLPRPGQRDWRGTRHFPTDGTLLNDGQVSRPSQPVHQREHPRKPAVANRPHCVAVDEQALGQVGPRRALTGYVPGRRCGVGMYPNSQINSHDEVVLAPT